MFAAMNGLLRAVPTVTAALTSAALLLWVAFEWGYFSVVGPEFVGLASVADSFLDDPEVAADRCRLRPFHLVGILGAPSFFWRRERFRSGGRLRDLAPKAVLCAHGKRILQETPIQRNGPSRIHAFCEDYRAGKTVDVEQDEADLAAGRAIACRRASARPSRLPRTCLSRGGARSRLPSTHARLTGPVARFAARRVGGWIAPRENGRPGASVGVPREWGS
jgi:hypothetical protein